MLGTGEASKPKRRRWRIWLAAAGLLFVVAVAVLSIAGARLEADAGRELSEVLAQLRKDGFATALEELVPPPVSKEENGATLIAEAFRLFRAGDKKECHNALFKARKIGFARLSPEEKGLLRDLLVANEPAVQVLKKAFSMPKCRMYDENLDFFENPCHSLYGIQRAAFILSLRADISLQEGKTEESFESIRMAFGLAETYAREFWHHNIVFHLVVSGVALEDIAPLVLHDTPLESLKGLLNSLPPQDAFKNTAGKAARGMLVNWTEIAGATRFNDFVGPPFYLWWRKKEILKRDLIRGIAFAKERIALCDKAYAVSQPELERLLRQWRGGPDWKHPLSGLEGGSYFFRDIFRLRAWLAVARAGLECEITRKEQGVYPDSVSDIDPFTEKPLLYDPENGLLYSAGPDMKDDGGSEKSDDIVWRLRQGPDAK